MTTMRAKMVVESVTQHQGGETLKFRAVPKNTAYPDDGGDEDNTYAKFSPQADLSIYVANPELHGKFTPGDKYYVDFTKA
ncbi:hypothetical protein EYW47_15015 [Paraburkholderia silviterrae]|uniref:Single-stranded DNA-binding protein n=2 Tax=Paraburkholderia silviterrae TaxID=2528715 RepID=A0A4R5M9Z9_9BURK|nr:hypothetical protein EYW47_15015 [Paraburkholderia silviterrae]